MKERLYLVVFFLPVFLVLANTAQGQTDWHVPSPESLSISLNGLRQSAKQMSQRNHWLVSEIKVLEMKIESIQRRTRYSDRSSELMEGQTSLRTKEEYFASVEQTPSSRLDKRIDAGSQHKERLLKDIAILTDEIESMNQLINQEARKSGSLQSPDNDNLRTDIETAQTNIKELERKIQAIDKQHSKSLERYESLKEKNNLLKQKYSLLDEDFKKAEAAAKDILDNMKDMESKNSKSISDMHKEISELRSEGNSLDKILNTASKKIKERNTVFEISDEEIELLMENYYFIEKENNALKAKYTRIQEDFKKLDQSAQN